MNTRRSMKKTRIKSVNLIILLLALLAACARIDSKEEVVTVVDKENNLIEKGLLVDGKREGYWVAFDTNYVLLYDIQYKNNILNGKTTHYFDSAITIETEMKNGERDGKYTSYHKYPIVASQGQVKKGKRVGEWRTYAKDGRLNKIIQFEKDTFKIVLDNKLE
ncbi:MAG TPA: hypothetical protein DIW31_08825 [Bacteroidales bacterium]|nr:hypothetical protein [Bacteroidales bacterium]